MTKNKQTFSIRETAEILVPDRVGRTSYFVALGLVLLMYGLITLILVKLPPAIPLYFSLPWGEARLAPKFMIYLLPSITLIFSITNLGLGRIASKLSPILPRVLGVTSAVVASMVMIALLGIVQSLIL